MTDMSVIIPTFNRKQLLRHTILALINQGILAYEVIICDDGSKDGTEETIQELKKTHQFPFELIYTFQENKGFRAGTARNMGIKIAKGERIVFLDQDIIIEQNVLKTFNRITENTFWTGSKKLVSLEFYDNFVSDDAILKDKMKIFEGKPFGIIPATLSSFGVILKKDLDRVDGFDDDFIGYGLEDTELIERLQDIRVRGLSERNCFGYHIAHPKNFVSKQSADIYHHKRNNRKNDGKKIPVNK